MEQRLVEYRISSTHLWQKLHKNQVKKTVLSWFTNQMSVQQKWVFLSPITHISIYMKAFIQTHYCLDCEDTLHSDAHAQTLGHFSAGYCNVATRNDKYVHTLMSSLAHFHRHINPWTHLVFSFIYFTHACWHTHTHTRHPHMQLVRFGNCATSL